MADPMIPKAAIDALMAADSVARLIAEAFEIELREIDQPVEVASPPPTVGLLPCPDCLAQKSPDDI